jgi:hypothetical protein
MPQGQYEKRQEQLEKIMAKIRNTAFKVKDVPSRDQKNPDEQKILSVCTKFRSIGKNKAITLKSFVVRDGIYAHHSNMEAFISELAEWILDCEEEEKVIIKDIKASYIDDTLKALKDIGCYRKGTIKKALSILGKDLSTMRLRNSFFSPQNNETEEDREDHYLYEIRSVYRKYFQKEKGKPKPLTFIQEFTPNQIISNMAVLLSAFDFLPDKKKENISASRKAFRYYEKIRKRFRILDKEHAEVENTA